jgi:uncharacterized membrane protein YgdD (TMEM256/DUF423 family)
MRASDSLKPSIIPMLTRLNLAPQRSSLWSNCMQPAISVILGGLLAALAVGLGAIGAHALKSQLTPERLETFHTAVQYQMYHAIGLVLVGLLNLYHRSRWFDLSGWAMLLGIILFSGFIYAWLATGRRFLVYPVPVGGVAFILGWVLFVVGAFDLRQR